MNVVIDIPDEDFNDIKDGYLCEELADIAIKAVQNGTSLPKGHRDLIDRDAVLINIKENCKTLSFDDWEDVRYYIKSEPTVIPADKGE